MLAKQLASKYRYENCAIMALDDGGVMIGAQIAAELHCVLTLMMSAEIKLPQEPTAIAGITPSGTMSYNHSYSEGELNELKSENFGLIEQQKLVKMHDMNHLVGSGGTIDRRFLKGHNVIVTTDGVKDAFVVDLAYEFLKPINIEKLIFAVPFASLGAVDRMHVVSDELYCLSAVPEYRNTDHYYDKRDVPDHETVLHTIEHIILNWK